MSTAIEVCWSATFDAEGEIPFRQNWISLLPRWAEAVGNATEVVAQLCKDCLDEAVWDQEWGLEETHAMLWVTIIAPLAIAGRYEVTLRRVVKAMARRLSAPG